MNLVAMISGVEDDLEVENRDPTSSEYVIFQIYYNGKFVVSNGNVLTYEGGKIHQLECKPEAVFTNMMESLGLSLVGQRIWYKLPFEMFTELKLMYCGDDNFEIMCLVAKWTKAVNIFMEKEEISEEYNDDTADEEGNDENADRSDDVRVGEESNDENANRAGDVRGGDDDDEVRAGVDEDEFYDSEGTPQNSDCDDVEREYIRYKKGSGDIRLDQVFDNIPQFKEVVVDYALKGRANLKFSGWGSEKSEVICSIGGSCKFRIYSSHQKSIGMDQVRIYNDMHSCITNENSKVLKDGVIAKLLLNDIRKDPNKYKPKAIKDAIEDRYNLVVTNDQCRKTKAIALSVIQNEYDEQFAILKDYRLELIDSNPESIVEVGTVRTDDGIEKFDRIYVCLAALRKT